MYGCVTLASLRKKCAYVFQIARQNFCDELCEFSQRLPVLIMLSVWHRVKLFCNFTVSVFFDDNVCALHSVYIVTCP